MEKAFDRVWNNGLLYKLKCCRVIGNLLKLIETFLRNRKNYFLIDSFCSDELEIQIGLPQGSVLSPILFILFTNDFLISAQKVFKYADDTSVLVHPDSLANLADQLGNLCSTIESWCFNRRMKVTGSKTEVLSLHTDEPMPSTIHTNGQICKPTEFTMSLGLIIDRKLTYKNHLDTAINKGQKIGTPFSGNVRSDDLTLRSSFSRQLSNLNSSVLGHKLQFGHIHWKSCKCKGIAL